MIFERCTFIIIYIALSGLSPSSSQAASSFADTPAAGDNIIRDRHKIDERSQSSFFLPRIAQTESRSTQTDSDRTQKQTKKSSSDNSPAAEQNSADSGLIEAFPRSWAFGAIGLTSTISLFLLWVLFRKPAQEVTVAQDAVADRQLATPTEAVSESELVTQAASEDSPSVDKAIASPDLDLDSDNSVITEKPSTLDLTGNRIDVVRELIQDLQPNDLASDNVSTLNDAAHIARRRKAIWELTKIGDYRSIEPLLKIVPQVREPDKSLIIKAVTQISSRSFQPINQQLFANLQDRDPGVRLSAVKDLKNLYQFVAPAITKMAQMQSDVDYEVRQTAIQALVQLNANPLPTFSDSAKNSVNREVDELVSGEDSKANLHLVAYLLEELDAKG